MDVHFRAARVCPRATNVLQGNVVIGTEFLLTHVVAQGCTSKN